MRKFIGVVSLLVVVFLVAMTLQFVLAQEGSKPPSKEIEIKPAAEATPAPNPTQAGEYQPNAESGQPRPFSNLIEGGGAPPSNFQQPTAPPTLPTGSTTPKSGQATPPPPVATATPGTTEGVPASVPKPAKVDNSIVRGLFKYTGWLWNGSEYVGIISSSKKGYTVKSGMELEDGYRVLQVNEKEVILVKEGQKGTIPLQEVQK